MHKQGWPNITGSNAVQRHLNHSGDTPTALSTCVLLVILANYYASSEPAHDSKDNAVPRGSPCIVPQAQMGAA